MKGKGPVTSCHKFKRDLINLLRNTSPLFTSARLCLAGLYDICTEYSTVVLSRQQSCILSILVFRLLANSLVRQSTGNYFI
jgi:hypothetical protein